MWRSTRNFVGFSKKKIKKEHSPVFSPPEDETQLFMPHYLMVHETSSEETTFVLAAAAALFSICYWSKSSFEDWCPPRNSSPNRLALSKNQIDHSRFLFFPPAASDVCFKNSDTELSNICPFSFFSPDLNRSRWRRLILFCCEAAW